MTKRAEEHKQLVRIEKWAKTSRRKVMSKMAKSGVVVVFKYGNIVRKVLPVWIGEQNDKQRNSCRIQ